MVTVPVVGTAVGREVGIVVGGVLVPESVVHPEKTIQRMTAAVMIRILWRCIERDLIFTVFLIYARKSRRL
jgi:hypothetical protein